ncbi:MAG TPA: DUF3515 domain-containing protein [Mycobacterium sp.]|nr:DUF3515 domain-containing protein [Mycobacterium sp.]
MTNSDDGPPRAALIAALLLAVAAVGVVLAIAATHRASPQPVAIAAVAAPHATNPACQTLLDALPQRLDDYRRAPVRQPAPAGTAAWAAGGGEPVVLRCGLDRPAEFVVGAPIQVVDKVQWFQVWIADRSTWYTVDRPVYVALTLPAGSGPSPIQQLSEVIDDRIAAVPIRPAPPGG